MKQDYTYALDAENRLVDVKSADKSKEYFCPQCGEKMLPKQGKIRRWHFAHKANLENCSYETYLHKISKMLLCKAINESQNFYIKFFAKVYCSIEECPVGVFERCNWSKIREFDLKDFYNQCEEEAIIENYRADLLLKSTEQINRPPVLIEIVVTHNSTEKKLNSKLRIIEVKIDSIEDIEGIISSKRIVESERQDEFSLVRSQEKIRFYNFKNELWEEPTVEHQSPKFRLWVDSLGYFRYDDPEEYDCNEKCLSPNPPEIENSIFRIESSSPVDRNFAIYKLAQLGYKACQLCKYCRKNKDYPSILCLHCRIKRSRVNNIMDAMQCRYFKTYDYNKEQMEVNDMDTRVISKKEDIAKFLSSTM